MELSKHKNPNGTINGVTAMAEMTGLSTDDIRAIAEQAKANQTKLDSCAYHEFSIAIECLGKPIIKARYRCKHCNGEVDAVRYRWHELGRRPRPDTPPTS